MLRVFSVAFQYSVITELSNWSKINNIKSLCNVYVMIHTKNFENWLVPILFQFKILRIPRSREVRQSWLSTIFTTLNAIIFSFPVVFREKPDLVRTVPTNERRSFFEHKKPHNHALTLLFKFLSSFFVMVLAHVFQYF